jgi:hypothetical protein
MPRRRLLDAARPFLARIRQRNADHLGEERVLAGEMQVERAMTEPDRGEDRLYRRALDAVGKELPTGSLDDAEPGPLSMVRRIAQRNLRNLSITFIILRKRRDASKDPRATRSLMSCHL